MYYVIFALCLASVACNDVRLGYATAQSRKIFSEIKEADPALWKRTDDIIVNAPNNEIISAVSVTDLRDDKDGEAYIESGGIGTKSVTIGLKSPSILRGYKFEIEVYGNDPNARYLTKGVYNEQYYDGQFPRKYYSMGLLEFEQWSNQPDLFSDHSHFCSKLSLTPGQRRVCRRHKEHMPVVSAGVRSGIHECQHQFSGRRWNCTVSEDGTVFGPLSFIASRETAFTYAVTAAGVSLSISRACRDGRLSSCSCSRSPRPKHLHNEWVWGGCGDNLEYGYKFTESFVDIRERERKVKRGSREQGRQLMNRHNNEAGRRAVIVKSKVTCKCHGVSGSCSLITCWNQLASVREVGDYLKDKYDGATEVKVSRRGKLRISNPRYSLPTAQDLVYLEESPNFCVKNESVGSQGTTGRECNRTSSGMDGCSLMCCGRGYNTKRIVRRERCNCKFHWCCRVDCDTCVKSVEVYTCK